MSVANYTASGTKATTAIKLDQAVFGEKVTNFETLKTAYLAYLANGRANLAVTKTRGEVRGGGKKPWRQKGTGRARFGSSRVPIWRGGGITFGPTGEENYKITLPTRTKRLALRQALSLAVLDNKLAVIEDIKLKEAKTSLMAGLLAKLNLSGRILVVVDNKTGALVQATNNLSGVKLVAANYLNTYDVINADHILITKAGLDIVSSWLAEVK
jgi:large subunit ribosomal protein L4